MHKGFDGVKAIFDRPKPSSKFRTILYTINRAFCIKTINLKVVIESKLVEFKIFYGTECVTYACFCVSKSYFGGKLLRKTSWDFPYTHRRFTSITGKHFSFVNKLKLPS